MKVQKIYNMYNHERVASEFKRLSAIKHKEKAPLDLAKHLFHGPSSNNPSGVYGSEDGLDMRHSNNGLNGYGIYFADSSHYSHKYAHKLGQDSRLAQVLKPKTVY